MPPKKATKPLNSTPDTRQRQLWQHKQGSVATQTSDFKTDYDLKWHQRNFNNWDHGYVWKNGYMWYRRADGVDVRAYAAVNELTNKGELMPKCDFTV